MFVNIRPKELTIPANKWFQVNLFPFLSLSFIRISSITIDIKQFVKQVIHVSDIIKVQFSFFCPNSLLIMSSWAIAYNIKNIRNAMQESICVHWFIPSSLFLRSVRNSLNSTVPFRDKTDVYSNMHESTSSVHWNLFLFSPVFTTKDPNHAPEWPILTVIAARN